MKKLVRRLLRSVINWAYGQNIALELHILRQAKKNQHIIMADIIQRFTAVQGNYMKKAFDLGRGVERKAIDDEMEAYYQKARENWAQQEYERTKEVLEKSFSDLAILGGCACKIHENGTIEQVTSEDLDRLIEGTLAQAVEYTDISFEELKKRFTEDCKGIKE